MQRISLMMLMMLSMTAHSQVSLMTTYSVYKKIASKMAQPSARLTISNSNVENAYCNAETNTIRFTTGILKSFRNVDELALVMGHELAHCALGHKGRSNPPEEFIADKIGGIYMERAGFNKCKGAKHMKRRNDPLSITHPRDSDRVHALGC